MMDGNSAIVCSHLDQLKLASQQTKTNRLGKQHLQLNPNEQRNTHRGRNIQRQMKSSACVSQSFVVVVSCGSVVT